MDWGRTKFFEKIFEKWPPWVPPVYGIFWGRFLDPKFCAQYREISRGTPKFCEIFEKSKNEKKCSIVVSAVTIDHLQSIGLMATVTETDINAYDSNPEKYSKRADNALKYISESKARLK